MLIFRYLAREVFVTLVSLTTILMLIFMSNQFVRYLNRAASGNIPGVIIMKLMMLELPLLMGLLLPLGFYVALLVAYGRLYAESEMTVMQACGYSTNQLLKHTLMMASVVALVVAVISFWVSPYVAIERAKLLRSSGVKTLIQTLMPGRFQAMSGGRNVFYVESMSRDHTQAEHVFFARQVEKNQGLQWDILWADKAFAETDPKTFEDYIVLEHGHEYEGVPGKADYQVAQFSQYKARIPHAVVRVEGDIRTAKLSDLLPYHNPDKAKAAELQWRLSIPIMVFTLALVAVPLSRVNPRAGKFAKLLPAIVIYILYANFMFVSRDAIVDGRLPVWIGLWWLHGLVLGLGLFLLWRNRVNLS